MPESEQVKSFDELVPKAAELHFHTFCLKDGRIVLTSELKGEECVRCPEFVCNGGICDPL